MIHKLTMMVFAVLASILVLLPADTDAGPLLRRHEVSSYCGSCYTPAYYPSYSSDYYAPDYTATAIPVQFTVAVPVVSYLQNGNGASFTPVYNANPAAGMSYIYQVQQQQAPVQQMQPQAQPQYQAQPTAAGQFTLSDDQVDYIIARIEQRFATRQQQQQPQATAPPPAAPPPAALPDVVTVLTLKRGGSQKSCADCHTGPTNKGHTLIFSSPGVLNPQAPWAAIWEAADKERMPYEIKATGNHAAALSPAEKEALRQKMLQVMRR